LISALAFIVGMLQNGCKSNSTVSRLQEVPPEPVVQANPTPRLVCPHMGAILAAVQQSKAGHRVTLSWKASRPPDSKHSAAIGYCVYRGEKEKSPNTELLNALPFAGTKCVDDSVTNGEKYYYVVRAISAKGVPSEATKPPVLAKIPATPRPASPAPEDSIPLCRESPGVK
jgi:hypothetical protein